MNTQCGYFHHIYPNHVNVFVQQKKNQSTTMNIIVSPPDSLSSNQAISLAQVHAPMWQRLLVLGDRLRDQGEDLTAFRRSLTGRDRVTYTDEEVDISVILLEAEKAVQDWTERRELFCPLTRESEHRVFTIAELQLRSATLQIQDGVMGDREAVRREAKLSGLARDIYEMIDEFELQVSVLASPGLSNHWLILSDTAAQSASTIFIPRSKLFVLPVAT